MRKSNRLTAKFSYYIFMIKAYKIGSLTGAVGFYIVTKPYNLGNIAFNGWKIAWLFKIHIFCKEFKPGFRFGHSVPEFSNGRISDHQTKVTLGITGWSPWLVLTEVGGWHLDVGSSPPRSAGASKGWAVRPLKAVRQLGSKRRKTV